MTEYFPSRSLKSLQKRKSTNCDQPSYFTHLKNRLKDVPTDGQFKLVRYFTAISLSAFVCAAIFLAGFYRHAAIQDVVALAEENNVALTQMFSNSLSQAHRDFLFAPQPQSREALVADPRTIEIYQQIQAQVAGLPVVKIKAFDLRGQTVFSTDLSQIGIDKSQFSAFQTARSGRTVSQLDHQSILSALRSRFTQQHLFSSYIPVRASGDSGQVIGVFELYSDVAPLLQRIHLTQIRILLFSLMILTLLYGILFIIIKRADRLLNRQYRQLRLSESRYRQQADTLEQTLTELKHTQAQMIQSEKMSALGQMVAGVAHEINNPINFIHGNLVYAKNYCDDLLSLCRTYEQLSSTAPAIQQQAEAIGLEFIAEDLPKLINSMRLGTERIQTIVASLQNFSRLGESSLKAVNIHEGLESTLVILQHRMKPTGATPAIEVVKDYGDLPTITCFPHRLNQVFMNLLNNAIDAVEEFYGEKAPGAKSASPTITIRTEHSSTTARILITDNGPGIASEHLPNLYNPFFTTKPTGKGTGLGLSISYRIIVEDHKGRLLCRSAPGRGTTFTIEIPICVSQTAQP